MINVDIFKRTKVTCVFCAINTKKHKNFRLHPLKLRVQAEINGVREEMGQMEGRLAGIGMRKYEVRIA